MGHGDDNYRVRDIAEIVASKFPGCEVTVGDLGGDNRSYRVNFDKIHSRLPGFSCEWDAEKGAGQLRELFERIDMGADRFQFRSFTRLKQLEYLISTRQVDSELFWKH